MIAELVARGHRVSYAIPESFAPIVASVGATPVVYVSPLPDGVAGQVWSDDVVATVSLWSPAPRL